MIFCVFYDIYPCILQIVMHAYTVKVLYTDSKSRLYDTTRLFNFYLFLVQVESAHFINPDNVESAIESALNQRSLFNFAIDLEGNRYVEQSDGSTQVLPPTSNAQQ